MRPEENDPVKMEVEVVKIEGDRNLYRYSFEIEDEAEEKDKEG